MSATHKRANHKRAIVIAAGILVLVSAAMHFIVGFAGLYDSFVHGGGEPVLAALYVLAGVAAVALIGAFVTDRIQPTRVYSIGAVLMVFYVAAYADYHVLNYADSVLPLDAVGLDHSHDHGHGGSHSQDPAAGHHDDGSTHHHDDGGGTSHHDDGHHDDGSTHHHDDGGGTSHHDDGHHDDGSAHHHDDGSSHSTDESALGSFVDHVRDDVYALVSKTAEATAAVLFGALAIVERD